MRAIWKQVSDLTHAVEQEAEPHGGALQGGKISWGLLPDGPVAMDEEEPVGDLRRNKVGGETAAG